MSSSYDEQLLRILNGSQELYEEGDEVPGQRHPRRPGSIRGSYRYPMLPGVSAYSNESRFGREKETHENTLTWGSTQQIVVLAGEAMQPTTQLVHVLRKRPTTYTVAVQLTLGAGWPGPPGDLILTVLNFIGVGQAMCTLVQTFTVLSADVAAGASVVNAVYQVPATALQVQAQLAPVNALIAPADAAITILAAPVFE